jgi:hypothetical protein
MNAPQPDGLDFGRRRHWRGARTVCCLGVGLPAEHSGCGRCSGRSRD